MRHRVNGRWPCKRTALVLRDGQVGGGTRAHAGAIRCSAWLQATWTQPVDIVRWDALLRSEVEAYSVVVLEAGVVPQERCEAVLVALRGVAGRRLFAVVNPTLVAAASAPARAPKRLRWGMGCQCVLSPGVPGSINNKHS